MAQNEMNGDSTSPNDGAVPAEPTAVENELPSEQRLGPLVGDRVCTNCGYNLAGQQIVREPHYGMIIVRCSECGTAAALQEYPILGRWANRWAVALAGTWLLLLLGLWTIFSGIVYAMSEGAQGAAASKFAIYLAEHQHDWASQRGLLEDPQNVWHYRRGEYAVVDDTWRRESDPSQLLADAGGLSAMLDWRALISSCIGFSFWLCAFGIVWSLLMPHVRRLFLPLTTLAIIGLAAVFWAIGEAAGSEYAYWMRDLARHELGWISFGVFLLIAIVAISIGALIGRTLARLLVRWLLPPRMRGALAPLWLIDGLEPPRSGHVR
jgi:hypothetical protein